MDGHLVETHIDPLDQGEKDDPQPQRRHSSPFSGEIGGTAHPDHSATYAAMQAVAVILDTKAKLRIDD